MLRDNRLHPRGDIGYRLFITGLDKARTDPLPRHAHAPRAACDYVRPLAFHTEITPGVWVLLVRSDRQDLAALNRNFQPAKLLTNQAMGKDSALPLVVCHGRSPASNRSDCCHLTGRTSNRRAICPLSAARPCRCARRCECFAARHPPRMKGMFRDRRARCPVSQFGNAASLPWRTAATP